MFDDRGLTFPPHWLYQNDHSTIYEPDSENGEKIKAKYGVEGIKFREFSKWEHVRIGDCEKVETI